MAARKVVILDGCGEHDQEFAPVLDTLSNVLERHEAEIETFHLRQMKLAHCIGCFGCWIKTPGMCVEDDAGRQIARAVIRSDATVFFTPVTFGGYSPEFKKMMDHFVQLISPYFQMVHGEMHHPPRYAHRPRLMMVGVQRQARPYEALIFRMLAGRNAINIHPPSYAAEVVQAGDCAESLRERFESMLERSDAQPFGEVAAVLAPAPAAPAGPTGANMPKRALLIVGSPKTSGPVTSRVLGNHLLDRLRGHGWETETLTLRASLNREEGQAELLGSLARAGLVLFVFPLYADALPYLATKALAVVAAARRKSPMPPQRWMALVNSGFPETHQNAVALAICREFAEQSGVSWAGGLALGGGGIVGAEPLNAAPRHGPPVGHVVRALDLTAAALAEGRPVPAEATRLMAKNPIPIVPFALWRRIYAHFGGKGFEQEAARNAVGKDRLLDQPYAA